MTKRKKLDLGDRLLYGILVVAISALLYLPHWLMSRQYDRWEQEESDRTQWIFDNYENFGHPLGPQNSLHSSGSVTIQTRLDQIEEELRRIGEKQKAPSDAPATSDNDR